MTQQIINVGIANKGNGDPIRTAFTKVNANFTELYNQLAASVVVDATAPTDPGEGDLWWDPESGRMYVYYGTSWVDASPVDGAGISSTNQLVNGNKTVSLGTEGKLTLPAGTTYEYFNTPLTGHGDGLARLDFTLATDGVNAQWLAASPSPAGSGYSVGNTFTFNATFLGIPGASVTIEVLSIGPGGSIDELGFTIPPLYPADIYRDSPINLQVGAESNRWTFGADSTLTLPGDLNVGNNSIREDGLYNDQFSIAAGAGNHVEISSDDGEKVWSFDTDGSLTFPSGVRVESDVAGNTNIWGASNKYIQLRGAGADGPVLEPLGGILINSNGTTEIIAQTLSDSASWTFNANDSLTFPDNSQQTTAWTGSVSSLVNSTKTVSLGSDGTLTLPAQAATLQTVDQIFTAKIYRATDSTNATAIQEAKDNWFGAELTFADIRDQDAQIIAPATRPWAGMPSYEAYPLIMEYNQDPPGGVLPPPGSIAPAANTATNAYIGYKELVSNIDIVSGDKVFSFENTGNLRVPGVVTSDDLLTLISSGTATLNSASVVADGDNGNVFVKTLDGNAGTEKTWTFGTTGSLTLPDNSVIASYKPVTVIANLSDDQTIPDNASASVLTLNALIESEPALLPGGVFSVPYTGYYQVNVSLYFTASVTMSNGFLTVVDTTSGLTTLATLFYGSHTGQVINGSMMMPMTAGHSVAFAFRQVSGAPIDVSTNTRVTIHRVSIS
jgi:hypothetical protein